MVEQALRLGYRHIDTAEMYDNEREVGEGLRASGIDRNESSSPPRSGPRILPPSSWSGLQAKVLVGCASRRSIWCSFTGPIRRIPLSETLGALCKVRRDGIARHIGVSNFTVPLMDQALRLSSEPLVCNQFEYHPYLDQSKLIAACRRHGMAVVAYSPIAKGRVREDERCPASGPRTKRPPHRSVCASWSSKTSSSFRAPARSNGCRRTRQSSILRSASQKWRALPLWRAVTAGSSILPSQVSKNRIEFEHDPEKWKPVFRKDHAQTKS